MFITPAFAQDAVAPAPNPIVQLIPFILMAVVFYFLLIRPQQQARKKHQEMVAGIKRGDTVVTAGGVVGKVIKAPEGEEAIVEVAEGVHVTVMKSTLSDVRSRTKPQEAKA